MARSDRASVPDPVRIGLAVTGDIRQATGRRLTPPRAASLLYFHHRNSHTRRSTGMAAGTHHTVVVNAAGQHALWPAERTVPAGWHAVGAHGTPDECVAFVDRVWKDIRPTVAANPPTGPLSVHDCFAAWAARFPDAVAVEFRGRRLTYADLDRRANQLAHRLLGLGVHPESRVAVLQERSADLIVSLLAVLKAGAAYVPLHSGYPVNRMALVMDDSAASVVLVDRASQELGFAHEAQVVVVDDPASGLAAEPETAPGVPSDGTALAYVIHTSGSTGTPKGVAVTHRSVVDFATDSCWADGAHRSVLFHAPYAFDISTYELWIPLLNGGRIVVAPPEPLDGPRLYELLEQHSVTAVHLTAGFFGAVADQLPECFSSVREVLTGGDVVAPSGVRRVLESCPATRVRHLYGPTETTLFATHCVLTEARHADGPLPLGTPREGVRIHVLDERLEAVPDGASGELFIGGSGVARGYLGKPGLTAERFLPDPYGPPGSRMYRTGDMVRIDPGGRLAFLGRQDNQVKIRGYRVELGEAESAFVRLPGVSRAAVVATPDPHGGKDLVAYIVLDAGSALSDDDVHRMISAELPAYMVPGVIVLLDELPLTPNGKTDRSNLSPH
ncbi:amino acid adenylation domain-containing protein [Streptomyces sp. NPDC018045]|uniref:amino acid adenylation domain-containing protein n=1 Tax=Streptomyces sp. NPDC018045 TaxID=3365037 RepID=UPI0037B2AEB8